MTTRKNVEAAKAFLRPRFGDPYVYGGMFTVNPKDGTDCSGVWNDTLGMAVGRFQWGREAEGATTESYRYIPVGGVGPFGTIRVARPQDIPANVVAKLAFHHAGTGGASSHMWGELDGMRIESRGGGVGLITQPTAKAIDDPYANAWAYLPGPIIEDGTAATAALITEPPDTLFADVSEFQVPVTDAYTAAGYRWLSIRSNDGTHRDKNFAANYAWCKRAADDGRITGFMVYFYWRTGSGDVDTHTAMVNAAGGPHPKMVAMIDVESGGNPRGDQSVELNAEYNRLAGWLGDPRRVIGYANVGDRKAMWQFTPARIPFILAGYGSNPNDPAVFKIAHQYTDGQGYGGGLPEGAPPFGNCDMNSADGFTATALAAALGLPTTQTNQDDDEEDGVLQTSRSIYRTSNEPTMSGDDASRGADATSHMNWVETCAIRGEIWALNLVKATANGGIGATKWWEVNAGNPNPGIDPWAIEKAANVLNYIAAANPNALQNAIAGKAS